MHGSKRHMTPKLREKRQHGKMMGVLLAFGSLACKTFIFVSKCAGRCSRACAHLRHDQVRAHARKILDRLRREERRGALLGAQRRKGERKPRVDEARDLILTEIVCALPRLLEGMRALLDADTLGEVEGHDRQQVRDCLCVIALIQGVEEWPDVGHKRAQLIEGLRVMAYAEDDHARPLADALFLRVAPVYYELEVAGPRHRVSLGCCRLRVCTSTVSHPCVCECVLMCCVCFTLQLQQGACLWRSEYQGMACLSVIVISGLNVLR